MARHLYVGPEGGILAVRESLPEPRIHIAKTVEQATEWYHDLLSDWPPRSAGHAITEHGLDILIGGFREGDIGELERVGVQTVVDEDGEEREDFTLGSYRLGPKGQRFIRCSRSFREFLKVWRFESNYLKQVCTLGDGLWAGQEKAVEAMEEYARCYFLKARRLGETTLGVAFDGWVLRFQPSCRVHLVSRIEKDAKDTLLKPLKFGIRRLPEEMLLDEGTDTTTVFTLVGGEDDTRLAEAFAAKEPGRGYGATHVHLDEWAAMAETSPSLPEDVWKAIMPTLNPDSTFHVLTTGKGPGFYADKWEEAVKQGGAPDEEGIPTLYPCFIPATGSRPDYTPERVRRERAEVGVWEYPEEWAEAIVGRAGTYFTQKEIDAAAEYARGFFPGPILVRDPESGKPVKENEWGFYTNASGKHRRRMLKAWDIGGPGETSDASVGVLLDITDSVWDVRGFVYLQGTSYPETAYGIEQFHLSYPGKTWIEDNAAGLAVRQFLKLPEDQVEGWSTTAQSKGPALRAVKIALGYRQLKWKPGECPELDTEMRRYMLKDENIKQDTVMALAIACSVAPEAAAVSTARALRLGIPGAV